MRGSKAKRLRRIAYEIPADKYSNNREYEIIKPHGQLKNPFPRTIIADHSRRLYQQLKGRSPVPSETYLAEMLDLQRESELRDA